MRRAFTLIELIFILVIVGILAAVAIPKYTLLRQKAEVAAVVAVIQDLNGSGGASAFYNATELNGIPIHDINMSDLYKFEAAGWENVYGNINNYSKVRYTTKDGKMKITLRYKRSDGIIEIKRNTCLPPYRELMEQRGYKKCGNKMEIYLKTQE